MTQVYVIGDSYVEALAAGSVLRGEQGAPAANLSVKFACLGNGDLLHEPFFEKKDGTIHFTVDQMTDALIKLTGQNAMAKQPDTVFGFSIGFHSASVYREPVWRQFAPWRVAEEARLPALSDAACELAFSKSNRFVFAFLDAAHDLGIDFFIIPAPPPQRHHHALKLGTRHAVLLEVDRLYRQWVARELDKRDYPYLPLPEVIAGDGFLRPDYESTRPGDDDQANPLYGALVAGQIRDFMAKRDADAAPMRPSVVILRGVRVNSDSSKLLA